MKQLPCITQYVLGKCLKVILTMTKNLKDYFRCQFLSWHTRVDRLTINASSCF